MENKPAVLVISLPMPRDQRELFARDDHFFMERKKAESDQTIKQIIPYIIVASGGAVLAYRRSAGTTEKRLMGQLSIGWGGHIEEIDSESSIGTTTIEQYIQNCSSREIAEELAIGSPKFRKPLGLIEDNITEVGRHHIGWAEEWYYDTSEITPDEETADQVFWITESDLLARRDEFETWSQLVIDRSFKVS